MASFLKRKKYREQKKFIFPGPFIYPLAISIIIVIVPVKEIHCCNFMVSGHCCGVRNRANGSDRSMNIVKKSGVGQYA
jgi:hypothetical protein